jgi:hypothetical protein
MRKKLQVAVVLLAGHKAQRAHMHNVGLTERQNCRLRAGVKEGSMHTHSVPFIGSDMLKIKGLGSKCVRPKNIENVRVGSLISTDINTRLRSAS